MTTRIQIRSMMAAILAVAIYLAIVRAQGFVGAMTLIYLFTIAFFAIRARPAGPIAVPVAIAALTDVAVVGLWPFWREVYLCVGTLYVGRMPAGALRAEILRLLGDPEYWSRLCSWEAWALSRWWLMFGVATLLSAPRADRAATMRRFLLFTPCFFLLEIGYLAGVWLKDGAFRTVPEPSTLLAGFWSFSHWLDRKFLLSWFIRATPATLSAGIAFFRIVPRWRWSVAILGAVAILPLAVFLSMFWSAFYLIFSQYNIIR